MCVFFCGGSCIEDISTHLMPHLSLHPKLKTCSADTILRAIKELTTDNITYSSPDSGKSYDFNTADTMNELLVKSLIATGELILYIRTKLLQKREMRKDIVIELSYKVTTKKRNAERYSDRIELQGFQSCFRLFVKPSQSPLKPNQDAATLLVRNHARNGDKRTRITKQGVKD